MLTDVYLHVHDDCKLFCQQTKDKMAGGKSVSLDEGIGSSVSTCGMSKPSVATSRGASLSDDVGLRHADGDDAVTEAGDVAMKDVAEV